MKHSFRQGARTNGITARTRIQGTGEDSQARRLTPKAVVDTARPQTHALHPVFEWDDSAAGNYIANNKRAILFARWRLSRSSGRGKRNRLTCTSNRMNLPEPTDLVLASPDLFALALTELQQKMNGAAESVRKLEAAARGSDDSDRLVRVGVAVKAIEMAGDAIRALH